MPVKAQKPHVVEAQPETVYDSLWFDRIDIDARKRDKGPVVVTFTSTPYLPGPPDQFADEGQERVVVKDLYAAIAKYPAVYGAAAQAQFAAMSHAVALKAQGTQLLAQYRLDAEAVMAAAAESRAKASARAAAEGALAGLYVTDEEGTEIPPAQEDVDAAQAAVDAAAAAHAAAIEALAAAEAKAAQALAALDEVRAIVHVG